MSNRTVSLHSLGSQQVPSKGCIRVFAIMLTAAWSHAASAQSDASSERAEKLFHEGEVAWDRGDRRTACARFAESQQVEPAPGTLVNLSACEEWRGHLLRARELCLHSETTAPPEDAEIRKTARECVRDLDARIPQLILTAEGGDLSGFTVRIDGQVVQATELSRPILLDPGQYLLEIWEGQSQREQKFISLAASVRLTHVVPRSRDARVAPNHTTADTPPNHAGVPSSSNVLRNAVGGAGLAFLVAAGIGTAMVLREDSEMDPHCPRRPTCDFEGVAAASRGKRWDVVATVGSVLGLGGVGAWLLWPRFSPVSVDRRGALEPQLSVGGKF